MSFIGAYNYSNHSDTEAAWNTLQMGYTNLAIQSYRREIESWGVLR
jgi:hypothetical protein